MLFREPILTLVRDFPHRAGAIQGRNLNRATRQVAGNVAHALRPVPSQPRQFVIDRRGELVRKIRAVITIDA
jgi:hypothetical protein